jgi:NAD(P)-dependent dehydrogenase (short-subunit alcohol dehydrogenase family)
LPYMRKQRSGRILQISSIGGRVGNAGLTIYQAAKFGLGGFSEALAKEVAPLGIKVTCVEPGGFRTDWAGTASTYYVPEVEGYETTVGVRKELFTGGKFIPMGDPDKAAKAMIKLAEDANPPVHLVLGGEAVGMIRQANAARDEDMEKWLPVSLSTNADNAEDVTQSEIGRSFFGAKK